MLKTNLFKVVGDTLRHVASDCKIYYCSIQNFCLKKAYTFQKKTFQILLCLAL